MARRMFESENPGAKPVNSHGEYPKAIIETAAQENVPCIDMTSLTMNLLEKEGFAASRRFYMNFDPGLYENFPEGRNDNSHLRPDGAYAYSLLAAAEIKKLSETFPEYSELSESCMNNTENPFNEVESNLGESANNEIDDEFTVFQK